ncbi:unnamed protein product, partial [Laminaria digitata]
VCPCGTSFWQTLRVRLLLLNVLKYIYFIHVFLRKTCSRSLSVRPRTHCSVDEPLKGRGCLSLVLCTPQASSRGDTNAVRPSLPVFVTVNCCERSSPHPPVCVALRNY